MPFSIPLGFVCVLCCVCVCKRNKKFIQTSFFLLRKEEEDNEEGSWKITSSFFDILDWNEMSFDAQMFIDIQYARWTFYTNLEIFGSDVE